MTTQQKIAFLENKLRRIESSTTPAPAAQGQVINLSAALRGEAPPPAPPTAPADKAK